MVVRVCPLATSRKEVRGNAHHDHSVNLASGDGTVSLVAHETVEIQRSRPLGPHSPLLSNQERLLMRVYENPGHYANPRKLPSPVSGHNTEEDEARGKCQKIAADCRVRRVIDINPIERIAYRFAMIKARQSPP